MIVVMCLVTAAIALTGRMIGKSISYAGNTADRTIQEIVIGDDVIHLPSNVIRFESQRASGVQNAVDTYFPGLE